MAKLTNIRLLKELREHQAIPAPVSRLGQRDVKTRFDGKEVLDREGGVLLLIP